MSDKTQPTYKETKLGILEIQEIEQIIFDNLILVQSYMYRNFETLPFSVKTLYHFHDLLCGNLFEKAGKTRKHNVQMGTFESIPYYQVDIEMKNLDDDISERLQHTQTEQEKKETIAYVMWKILWIHPFFDYNARVTRLFWELFLLKQGLPTQSFRGKSRNSFAEAMKFATFEHDFSKILALLGA